MYKLLLDKKVVKYLKRLSESDYYANKSKILTLADNPRPLDVKNSKEEMHTASCRAIIGLFMKFRISS